MAGMISQALSTLRERMSYLEGERARRKAGGLPFSFDTEEIFAIRTALASIELCRAYGWVALGSHNCDPPLLHEQTGAELKRRAQLGRPLDPNERRYEPPEYYNTGRACWGVTQGLVLDGVEPWLAHANEEAQ